MKKIYIRTILLITIFALFTINSKAQDKKPEVPEAKQNLMKFIGRWDGEATLTMGGKAYKVPYWFSCKKTADGNGIYGDEGFTSPELGTLMGANLAGFDPYDSNIKWFTVDNMGTTHEHIGDWKTPDHLYMDFKSVRDGKKFVEAIDFVFKGKNELNFKLVSTLDGVETEKGEGVFHKK